MASDTQVCTDVQTVDKDFLVQDLQSIVIIAVNGCSGKVRDEKVAKDKTFEWRMQGMLYAYEIAKKDGIEELHKEIKRRGLTQMQFTVSTKQLKETWDMVCANMYTNMMTCMFYALRTTFRFGRIRLNRLKESFDKLALDAMELDWMGEHFVKLEDYAAELCQKCNLDIDVIRVAASQDCLDERKEYTKRCKVDTVLGLLRENGYSDAAMFLQEKIGA